MRRWAGWWLLIGVGGLAGCSGAESGASTTSSEDASGIDADAALGGQTGSLVPDCELAPGASRAIPEGDAAFVVYGQGCEEAASEGRVAVTNADQEAIEVMLEPLAGSPDTYVARTSQSLEAGEYEVSLPQVGDTAPGNAMVDVSSSTVTTTPADDNQGGASNATAVATESTTVMVIEAQPLPMTLGTLSQGAEARSCGRHALELTLSDEVRAYLPLMRVSVSVDDSEPLIIYNYGALDTTQGELSLPFDGCQEQWACLNEGEHEVAVIAEIAGEATGPDPVTGKLIVDCPEDSSSQCSLSLRQGAPRRTFAWDGWIALGIFVASATGRRRRKRVRSTARGKDGRGGTNAPKKLSTAKD